MSPAGIEPVSSDFQTSALTTRWSVRGIRRKVRCRFQRASKIFCFHILGVFEGVDHESNLHSPQNKSNEQNGPMERRNWQGTANVSLCLSISLSSYLYSRSLCLYLYPLHASLSKICQLWRFAVENNRKKRENQVRPTYRTAAEWTEKSVG